MKRNPCLLLVFIALLVPVAVPAQDIAASPSEPSAGSAAPAGSKRAFGVLPNYRTAEASDPFMPITTHRKFVIASKDSFDYPLVGIAGVLAGLGQLSNQNPSFGQGAKGFMHRWGTAYVDQAVGNMFSEAIYPSLLKEDPRYFRLGTGSTGHRALYAMSRVFVTRTDSGSKRFNFSEWMGSATVSAISNAYYPDQRNARDSAMKMVSQVGTDAVSQVLKEFWPDIHRKLSHHKSHL